MRPHATAIIIAALVIPACTLAADPNQPVVQANNTFAFNLFAKLKDQPANLFFSPYSISTAMAIACAGARGTTAEQMANTLCLPTASMSNEQFHRSFGELIRKLNAAGEKGGYELTVANALWGQTGFKFLPDFLDLVKSNYDGNLQQVDFKTQTESARKTINAWVEQKTNDKIKNLIKTGQLDPLTRLVLTNAVYFKGNWASRFIPEQTKDAPFMLLGGAKLNAPMMHQTAAFGYTETDTIQVLLLPYVDNDLSMLILLPKKLDGVKDLEKDLTNDNLDAWLAKLRKREVQVFVPKFKLTSEFSLAHTLSAMGMPDAFSQKADFSGMTDAKDLFISAVVHKAYVDVNEEGTEAAAATGVTVSVTSVAPRQKTVFRADHPFIFLIRDNSSASILFLGRLTNPKPD